VLNPPLIRSKSVPHKKSSRLSSQRAEWFVSSPSFGTLKHRRRRRCGAPQQLCATDVRSRPDRAAGEQTLNKPLREALECSFAVGAHPPRGVEEHREPIRDGRENSRWGEEEVGVRPQSGVRRRPGVSPSVAHVTAATHTHTPVRAGNSPGPRRGASAEECPVTTGCCAGARPAAPWLQLETQTPKKTPPRRPLAERETWGAGKTIVPTDYLLVRERVEPRDTCRRRGTPPSCWLHSQGQLCRSGKNPLTKGGPLCPTRSVGTRHVGGTGTRSPCVQAQALAAPDPVYRPRSVYRPGHSVPGLCVQGQALCRGPRGGRQD
jgi:hypothetical protein